jgi:hypothetical protein
MKHLRRKPDPDHKITGIAYLMFSVITFANGNFQTGYYPDEPGFS